MSCYLCSQLSMDLRLARFFAVICLVPVSWLGPLSAPSLAGDEGNDRRLAMQPQSPQSEPLQADRPKTRAQKERPERDDPQHKTATQAESTEPDIERLSMAFIEKHEPKLAKLMEFLKTKRPAAYQKALREMNRSRQRLEGLEKRDADLYAIELNLWQLRSRLRLLAAELSVAKEPELDALNKQLTSLVSRESEQDLERLKLLRGRTEKQLARLDEDIRQRTLDHDEIIAKAIRSWQTKIKKNP